MYLFISLTTINSDSTTSTIEMTLFDAYKYAQNKVDQYSKNSKLASITSVDNNNSSKVYKANISNGEIQSLSTEKNINPAGISEIDGDNNNLFVSTPIKTSWISIK